MKPFNIANIALSACILALTVLFAASFFPSDDRQENFAEADEAKLESPYSEKLTEEANDASNANQPQPPAAARTVQEAKEAKHSEIPATTTRKTGGGGGGGGSNDGGSTAQYENPQPATPATAPANPQPATLPAIEFEKIEQRPEIIEQTLLEKKGEEEIEVIITLNKNIREGDGVSAFDIASAANAINIEAQQLETLGAKIEGTYKTGNIVVAKIKPSELLELTRNGDVAGVFENREVHAVLDESVPQITANSFWDAGFKGEGVKIAILDTGIDSSHPMLKGKVIAEKQFTGEDHTTDFNGHGTHVAGTAAGTKATGGSYDGVAPNAMLINGKVLSDSGSGSTAGIIAGIDWAVNPDGNPATDDGADIISMSLGGKYNEPFDPMSMAIKDAVAYGILVVVASGNCGACGSCGGYKGVTTPGNSPWAFSVGAVDKGNEVACFSGGGIVSGVGIKPDVTAPGVGIKSSVPGGYSTYQGTSMATPHVAGAAALLLSKNNKLTPQQIRTILENTAADFGTEGKDTYYGYGVINLSAAFKAKAAIIAKDSVSGSILASDTILENITLYNFGSDKMQISVTHDAWIKLEGLASESFTLEPATNKSFSYRITGAEAGTGHHNGKVEITTDAPNLPSKSISFNIDIFESTAPSFSKANFGTEVFSGEEITIDAEVTDNGDVTQVSAEVVAADGSFPPVSSNLERISAQLWKGLLKMPTVSSATKGRIKITATDNEGHTSALEKEITITDVIVTINPKEGIVQGTSVDFSAVFVNSQNTAIDVLAEFALNDSFGLTVFRDVDGSLTLPTGLKAEFTSQWTTEKYGTYDAIISIKKTDGTLIANRSETLLISLPKWGEIFTLNLPETAVKGTNLSYSIDFHNTGPVPYEAVAVLSLADERENTRLVMESEEKTIPAGGTATLSDSNKVEIDGGNYTAVAIVSYGNREEFESRPFTVLMPPILKLESLEVQKSAEYRTPTLPVSFSISNNGEVSAFAEFITAIIKDGVTISSEKINGTEIMPGETALLNTDVDSLPLQTGSYLLKLNISYEGQNIEAEAAFEITDTKAPTIMEIKAGNIRRLEPLTVKVAASDESGVANKTVVMRNPATGTSAERNLSASKDYATFFETGTAGTYSLEISVCDIYGNCNSTPHEIEVSECDGQKILVINNTIPESSAAVFTQNSPAECTYTYDTDKADAPTGEYLKEFDAVVWSSGSRTKGVPEEYTKLLLKYAEKGRTLIEGAAIALRHRNDEFMQNVTHSTLKEDFIIDATKEGDMLQSSPPLNMTETAAHYITLTAPEIMGYDSGMSEHPDSVNPLNNGTGIFKWADAGHSAVAYEDAATGAKSVFLPFDASRIEAGKRDWLAQKSMEWLLLGKAEDDIATSLNYGYLVEGDNEIQIAIDADTAEAIHAELRLTIDGKEMLNTNAEITGEGLTIPAIINLQTGTHQATLKAITQKPEKNYENNVQSYTLTVAPGMPDIKAEEIRTNSQNRTITANALISNNGGTAGETQARLYIDNAIANSTLLEIEAGEATEVSLSAEISTGLHILKISSESDDYNNSNNNISTEAYLCSGKKIFVVNDNIGEYSTEKPESADEFVRILKKGLYCIDEWDAMADGSIPAGHLDSYDAVIWSRGNYFGGTPEEATATLNSYKGAILLEGADTGMEHSEDAILETVFGAAFGTDLIVTDAMQLALKPEPITEGLETLEISASGSPYPDSMQPTGAATAAEWPEGGAAITTNEPGGHRKTAMYAFSINGITEQNTKETLVLNTIKWILEISNDLPDDTQLNDTEDIFASGFVIKMYEGRTKNFSIIASDPDNDTLTFKWLLNGTLVSETTNFTFSPDYNESGSYNLTILVSDGIDETRASYTIEVLDFNTPPVLAPIGNRTIKENEALDFSISATDNEDTALFFNATGLPESAAFDNETAMFSWIPNFEQAGFYELIFNVSDGLISTARMSDHEQINISVENVNRAPQIKEKIWPEAVMATETEKATIKAKASDPDGDEVTYAINDTRFEQASPGEFEWQTGYEDAGLYELIITASDGELSDETQTILLLIKNLNRKPVIESIENKTIKENSTLTFEVKASDPDKEDKITTEMIIPAGMPTAGMEFDESTGIFEWTPNFEHAGEYEIIFRTRDKLDKAEESINITVENVNRAPEIMAISPELLIHETEKATTAIAANDPDGDEVTYAINDTRFEQALPGEFEWQTGYEDAGEYILQLNATDGSLTTSHEAKIKVLNLNRNPIIESPENKTIKENSTLTFEVKASDPDKEDSLTWMTEYPEEAAGIEYKEGKFNWTPNFEQAGVYELTFSVSDGQATTSTSINITVNNTNRPPVIEMLMIEPLGLIMSEGETKTFYPALNDPDSDELGLVWKVDGTVAHEGDILEFMPDYDSAGKHTIQLTANDAEAAANIQVEIQVLNVNRAPSITSEPVQQATEEQAYTYTVTANDPDTATETGDKLAFSLTEAPAGMTINSATGEITWIPTNEQSGDKYTVIVKATDKEGAEDVQTYHVAVENVNDKPTITSTPPTTATEETTYTYQTTSEDDDYHTANPTEKHTYTLTTAPTGMNINTDTGLIEWMPTNEQAQREHDVRVTVTDSESTTAVQAYTINVANTNDEPRLASEPITEATEEQQYTYDAESNDDDFHTANPTEKHTYTLTTAPTGMNINTNTGLITWTPTNEQAAQTHTVIITVSDSQSATATQEYKITATNTNDQPTITTTPPKEPAEEETQYNYQPESHDDDLDNPSGEKLTYTLEKAPTGMSINTDTGLIEWTPTNEQAEGVHDITIKLTDKEGAEYTQNFNIQVTNTNDKPTITSTPPTTATEETTYTYQTTSEDDDFHTINPTEAHDYTLTTAPQGMTINSNTGLITWTPTNEQSEGKHAVTVAVTDKAGSTAAQSYEIEVKNSNDQPKIISTPANKATEERPYTYKLESDDDDFRTMHPNETRSYSLLKAPEGMSIDARTGTISWTPTNEQAAGTSEVIAAVTDSKNSQGVQKYFVSVANTNDKPTANAGSDATTNEATAITLSAAATTDDDLLNPSGEVLTYKWDFNMDGVFNDAEGREVTFVRNDNGFYKATVKATDKAGAYSTDSTEIRVLNVPPTAEITSIKQTSSPPLSAVTTFAFSADAYDPGNDTLTFEWNFGDGKKGYGRNTLHAYTKPGKFTVKLSVRDDDGGVGTAERSVQVTGKGALR